MNNFTNYIVTNYDVIPEHKTQFSFNQRAKNLVLSTNTFNKYMTTFNYMAQKPRFILPKIQMLPANFYDSIKSMPPENIFFKYKLNKKKIILKQDKEDLLDSLTSSSRTTTEYSSLRIFHQNKDPLMSNILAFLNSKILLDENSTFNKEKTIKTKRSQMELSIESLSLVFKKKGALSTQRVFFPFDIMPFFFAVNHDNFLFFLSKVINISPDLAKISINFEELKEMVSKFKKFASLFKADSHLYKYTIIKATNWKYDWIYNDQIIQLKIELPTVQCVLYGNNSKQKVKFTKVIDQSYVVELLKSNFVQWDNAMLLYLSQYKLFRVYAKELNRPNFQLKTKQMMTINLDTGILLEDLNQQFYAFFVSSKDENFFIKLYSYQFEVNIAFKADDTLSEFIIPTNLQDIYKLESLKEFFDLSQLIKKCLVINTNDKTVTLNSEIYKTIDESTLSKSDYHENYVYKEDKMIIVTNPRFDWKIFGRTIGNEGSDQVKIIENMTELSPQLVSDLLLKPINDWSSAIQANQKSFETDLSLFCAKRRSSVAKARSVNKKRTYSKSPTIIMRGKKKTKKDGLISLLLI